MRDDLPYQPDEDELGRRRAVQAHLGVIVDELTALRSTLQDEFDDGGTPTPKQGGSAIPITEA